MFGVVSKEPITPRKLLPIKADTVIQEWFSIAGNVLINPRFITLFHGGFDRDLHAECCRITGKKPQNNGEIFHVIVSFLGWPQANSFIHGANSWIVVELERKMVRVHNLHYRRGEHGIQFGLEQWDHPEFSGDWMKGNTVWPSKLQVLI